MLKRRFFLSKIYAHISHMYMLNVYTKKVKLIMVSCVHSKFLSQAIFKQDNQNDQFNEVAAFFMSWLIPSFVIFP